MDDKKIQELIKSDNLDELLKDKPELLKKVKEYKSINIFKEKTKNRNIKISDNSRDENDLLLQIRNLDFSYKKGRKILDNLNLDIYKGDRISLLGFNGCGKTTLLNIILGYLKKDTGFINLPKYSNTNDFLKTIGAQYQKAYYTPNWTVKDAIDFMIDISFTRSEKDNEKDYKTWKDNFYKTTVNAFIKGFELEKKMYHEITMMSEGQQRRLNILLSLIKKPDLLILDEFTSGLDITGTENAIKFISDYVEEKKITLLIISHIKHEVLSLSNRIVILDKGNIKNDFDMSEMKKDNINVSDYIDNYFIENKLDEKYNKQLPQITRSVNEYKKRGYQLTNPLKNKYRLSTVNKEEYEQPIVYQNSIHAFNRVLFKDFWNISWILPVLFLVIMMITIPSIYNGFSTTDGIFPDPNFDYEPYYSQLFRVSTLVLSIPPLFATLATFLVWGIRLFRIRSDMNLKRIEISSSSRNNFINYSLLVGAGIFVITFMFAFIIVVLFQAFGWWTDLNVLISSKSSEFPDANSVWNLFNTNFSLYFGVAFLNLFSVLGTVLIITTLVEKSISFYLFSTITFFAFMFFSPIVFVEGTTNEQMFNIVDNYDLYDGTNYMYNENLMIATSVIPPSSLVNLYAQAGYSSSTFINYVYNDSSPDAYISIITLVTWPTLTITYGLLKTSTWTNVR